MLHLTAHNERTDGAPGAVETETLWQGQDTPFHILSVEGPDGYARAGGIASRVTGLAQALAELGFPTHLWFVGDPNLPGHECQGPLHLHRWCQWISHYHPGGVYVEEEGKRHDYAASLPPFLLYEALLPHLRQGGRAVVLAEEWHTVDAVLHLDWLLRREQMRDQVTILWNANNVFCFDRVDWARLSRAAVITTVSRYMKHLMQRMGVEALAIPNGLGAEDLVPVRREREMVATFRSRTRGRTVLSKVARWDPDKCWLLAIETVRLLKTQGWRPLLIARGGVEAHGEEVMHAAAAAGLHVEERTAPDAGGGGLLEVVKRTRNIDVLSLRSYLNPAARRVLYRGSAAVLTNSRHEPFGLVGLEAMAARGVACTWCSGEDYAAPGQNALVLETDDPQEFVGLFRALRANPGQERALRQAGRLTAKRYAWPQIIQGILLPRLRMLADHNPLLPYTPTWHSPAYGMPTAAITTMAGGRRLAMPHKPMPSVYGEERRRA